MRAALLPAVLLTVAAPVFAESDELRPVRAAPLIGKAYPGAGAPATIRFVNTRRRAVRLVWLGFDGGERLYATLPPGGEQVQPTFVGHRWLATRKSGTPIVAFIATRADIHADGVPQIAIIR